MAVAVKTGVCEVEVLRRWRGSPVNGIGPNGEPGEKCGIPEELAKNLAALDPPAVRILRHDVPPTEGISTDGVIGGDAQLTRGDALIELVTELVQELKLARGAKK